MTYKELIEKHERLIREYDDLKAKADSMEDGEEKKALGKKLASVYIEIVKLNIRRMGVIDHPAT
jgi:hypothetical protein